MNMFLGCTETTCTVVPHCILCENEVEARYWRVVRKDGSSFWMFVPVLEDGTLLRNDYCKNNHTCDYICQTCLASLRNNECPVCRMKGVKQIPEFEIVDSRDKRVGGGTRQFQVVDTPGSGPWGQDVMRKHIVTWKSIRNVYGQRTRYPDTEKMKDAFTHVSSDSSLSSEEFVRYVTWRFEEPFSEYLRMELRIKYNGTLQRTNKRYQCPYFYWKTKNSRDPLREVQQGTRQSLWTCNNVLGFAYMYDATMVGSDFQCALVCNMRAGHIKRVDFWEYDIYSDRIRLLLGNTPFPNGSVRLLSDQSKSNVYFWTPADHPDQIICYFRMFMDGSDTLVEEWEK